MPDSVEEQPREDEPGTAIPPIVPPFSGETPSGTGDGCVQVAYCHTSRVSHSWFESMMAMVVADDFELIRSAPMGVYCGGPYGIIEGRNTAARRFLDDTPHEWLLWVDTDMGFQPSALRSLLAAADPDSRPVVGALCFAMQIIGADGYSGYTLRPQPTLFGIVQTPKGPVYANKSVYKPDRMNRVAGTGSAFILVHRSILEAIRAKHGDEWYTPVAVPGMKPISEDLSFCWRVADLMKPIFVHTGVKVTHHKEIWLGEDQYEMPNVDPVFGDQ